MYDLIKINYNLYASFVKVRFCKIEEYYDTNYVIRDDCNIYTIFKYYLYFKISLIKNFL